MAQKRVDPYRNYRFRVEIDGIQSAGFSNVTIPDSTSAPIEYREGTDPTTIRQLSGLAKYGSLTLKRGITDTMDLYNWYKTIMQIGTDDPGARKNISIILVNEQGQDKARWDIINAWPSKYQDGDLDGKGNDVLVETLEITHEGITRVS